MGAFLPRRTGGGTGATAEPLLAGAAPVAVGAPGADGAADGSDVDVERGRGVSRDVIDRYVHNLVNVMLPGRLENLRSPRIAGILRQLRRRVLLTIFSAMLMVPIALWLLVSGVITYATTDCTGMLRAWLLGFILLQVAWPVCMPSLTILLIGWCLSGALMLRRLDECPTIFNFLWEALVLQIVQAILLFIVAVSALTARPLVQQLSRLLDHEGTDPDVISLISMLPAADIPADEECVICLSREDEDGVVWRELVCGHRFHQPCLLEWLAKSRKCPVCRLDLHEAYQLNSQSGDGEVPLLG